jgi:LPXTG-motif cell wall-anchored protein
LLRQDRDYSSGVLHPYPGSASAGTVLPYWMVVERNVPAGYIMTVEERELSFVVTNTLDTAEPPIDPPDTGDTFNLLLPILMLAISGIVLLIFGIVGKKP